MADSIPGLDAAKLVEAIVACGDRAWDIERYMNWAEDKWQYEACVYTIDENSGIGEGCKCIADTPEEALSQSLRKLINKESCIE